MNWDTLYNQDNTPTMEAIGNYIGNVLWEKLTSFLEETYRIKPQLSYSLCSLQPGWNIKYRKSGKSLCTIYPMNGSFIALIVIGNKESLAAELLLPSLSYYTQGLYQGTTSSTGSRWLMINVTEPAIMNDLIRLIQLRVTSK